MREIHLGLTILAIALLMLAAWRIFRRTNHRSGDVIRTMNMTGGVEDGRMFVEVSSLMDCLDVMVREYRFLGNKDAVVAVRRLASSIAKWRDNFCEEKTDGPA